jgi:hypothetical protein
MVVFNLNQEIDRNSEYTLFKLSNHFYIYKQDSCVAVRAVFYFVSLSVILELGQHFLETLKPFFPTAVHFNCSLICVD